MNVFEDYEKYLAEDSVFVGHSLGSAFILSVLEKLQKPIKAAFFVAGFTDFLNNPRFDEINKSFVDKEFFWDKIKDNCKRFYVLHSADDPYVPLGKAEELAKKQVLTYGINFGDLGTLDPHLTNVGYVHILQGMFNSLVRYPVGDMGNNEGIEPDLAVKWDVSSDNTIWTFYLRKGVQFHKGYGELTSEDVKFSFERQKDMP